MQNEVNSPCYQESMYGKGVLFHRPFKMREQAFLIPVQTLCEFYQHGPSRITSADDVLELYKKYAHLINAAADAQLSLYQILVDQKKLPMMPDVLVVLEVLIAHRAGKKYWL